MSTTRNDVAEIDNAIRDVLREAEAPMLLAEVVEEVVERLECQPEMVGMRMHELDEVQEGGKLWALDESGYEPGEVIYQDKHLTIRQQTLGKVSVRVGDERGTIVNRTELLKALHDSNEAVNLEGSK